MISNAIVGFFRKMESPEGISGTTLSERRIVIQGYYEAISLIKSSSTYGAYVLICGVNSLDVFGDFCAWLLTFGYQKYERFLESADNIDDIFVDGLLDEYGDRLAIYTPGEKLSLQIAELEEEWGVYVDEDYSSDFDPLLFVDESGVLKGNLTRQHLPKLWRRLKE